MTRHRRAHTAALLAAATLLVPATAHATTTTTHSEVPDLQAPMTGLFLVVEDGPHLLAGHRIEDLCAGAGRGTITLHAQESDGGASYRQWYREPTELHLYEDVDPGRVCDDIAEGATAPEPLMSGHGRMTHDLTAVEDANGFVLDVHDTAQGTMRGVDGRVVPVSAGTTYHLELGSGPPVEVEESSITLRR